MKLFNFAIAPDARPAVQPILDACENDVVYSGGWTYTIRAEVFPKVVGISPSGKNGIKISALTIYRDGSQWDSPQGHAYEGDSGIFATAPKDTGIHPLYHDGRMLIFRNGKALTESYVVGKLGYYPVCLSEREKAILDPEYQHPVGDFPHLDKVCHLGRYAPAAEGVFSAGYPSGFALRGEGVYLGEDFTITDADFDAMVFSTTGNHYLIGKDGGWIGGIINAVYTVGDVVDLTITNLYRNPTLVTRLGVSRILDVSFFSVKPLMAYWGERVVLARVENQSGEWELRCWKSGKDITDFYQVQFGDRIDLSEDELLLLQMA